MDIVTGAQVNKYIATGVSSKYGYCYRGSG